MVDKLTKQDQAIDKLISRHGETMEDVAIQTHKIKVLQKRLVVAQKEEAWRLQDLLTKTSKQISSMEEAGFDLQTKIDDAVRGRLQLERQIHELRELGEQTVSALETLCKLQERATPKGPMLWLCKQLVMRELVDTN